MPSLSPGVQCAALVGCLLLAVASGEAHPPVRNVLMLQSFDRGNMILDYFTANFRVDLDRRAGTPVNLVQVVVGPTGSVGAPEDAIVDYIQSMFADGRKPDLIVTLAGPAAVFARKHRQQLFPEAPLLFGAIDRRYLGDAPLGERETAVPVLNEYSGLVEEILQLRPDTRQIFMVAGSGQLGTFWRRELGVEFRRFQDRVTFVWSDDLSLPDILRRCASLPDNSAIFYLNFGTDAQGAAYADERVLADLRATANAPLFSVQSPLFGYGIVGGTMMSIGDLAGNTAEVANRLLNGASPASLRVPPQTPGPPTFDWRELQRWGIAENRLPPGSIVLYRGPNLWQAYRRTVLIAVAVLIVQSLLIAALLYQRRARQRAEMESRKNLALAADASRRQTMSALTSSMTHELGQPLTSIMVDAHTVQMMVAADRATSDTIGEILSDIEAQCARAAQIVDRHRTMLRNRQMEKEPIDLHAVIHESLALVTHDIKEGQIETTLEMPLIPCVISGDQVLLQQVLVNLVMNAIDAMAETPPARRRITIRSEVRAADCEVSVRDTGPGVAADIIGKLFTPFVTTKSQGLGIGLTIVRTILDAHGGTIEAHNNPEGGATFTVRLPRSQTPEIVSRPPAAEREFA